MRREAHGSAPRGGPCAGTRRGPPDTGAEEARGVVARAPPPLRLSSFLVLPPVPPPSSGRFGSRADIAAPPELPRPSPTLHAHSRRSIASRASSPPGSQEESTAAACSPAHL